MSLFAIGRRRLAALLMMALVAAAAVLLTGCTGSRPSEDSAPVATVAPLEVAPTAQTAKTAREDLLKAAPTEPAEPNKNGLSATAVLAEAAPVVSAIRGLPAVDIEPGLLNREELAAYLLEVILEDHPPEEQAMDNIEWSLLGILAPGEDILEVQLELLSEDVLGFYNQDEKTMFVIGEGDAGLGMLKYVLTHEYVHALQDAAFDLGAIDEAIGTHNADASAAFTALVEGDATVAGVVAFFQVVTQEELTEFQMTPARTPSSIPSRARTFLEDLLSFSYTSGQAFVERLIQVGGWERVDAAYADLPVSTEQILYPDKYLTGELPQDVEVPDLSESAMLGWREQRRNVMGAFFLDLLFGGFVPGNLLADGWGGDEYVIYENGMDNLLILKMRWDPPAADLFWDNATFFLQENWLDPFQAEPGRTLVAGDLVTWEKDFRAARLFRDGDDIYLVVGTDSAAVERVWDQLTG